MAVRELVAAETLGPQRAREALGLEPVEFELAVELGEVRTSPAAGGRRRVTQAEVDRLRAEEGFPQSLRERLRTAGSADGADLIGITRDRFTKLAKGGLLQPVRWYVNRYRAVVWLYSVDEIRWFAASNPALLDGRLPVGLRQALDEGEDHRARGWRARRVEQLRRDAVDDWEEAAVWTALLGPENAAEAVPDIYERAYLRKLKPGLPPGITGPYASQELVDATVTADHPDEIAYARFALAHAMGRARARHPAPRPEHGFEPVPEGAPAPGAAQRERPRRRWLRLLCRS
jgi:hypothetical protein